MRPKSIVYYEYAYLACVLLGIVGTAMSWSAINTMEGMDQVHAVLGQAFLPILYVFIYTISLALWYFTARVPNAIAKWIVVGWFGLSVIGTTFAIVSGHVPTDVPGWLGIAALVLNAVAVYFLLRPDAQAWFGETA